MTPCSERAGQNKESIARSGPKSSSRCVCRPTQTDRQIDQHNHTCTPARSHVRTHTLTATETDTNEDRQTDRQAQTQTQTQTHTGIGNMFMHISIVASDRFCTSTHCNQIITRGCEQKYTFAITLLERKGLWLTVLREIQGKCCRHG